VSFDLGGAANNLLVKRVLYAVFYLNHDGLVHLVADYIATTSLAVTASTSTATSLFTTVFSAILRPPWFLNGGATSAFLALAFWLLCCNRYRTDTKLTLTDDCVDTSDVTLYSA
jgi:hypothetical protein